MIKYNDVLGMSVMSIEEGKVLGKVTSEFVDVEEASVLGFTIETVGQEKFILLLKDIKTFGADAIMITSRNKLKNKVQLSKEKKSAIKFGRRIVGLKIMTKKGKEIPEGVASFHFDPKTGRITHYETSEGILHDVLDGKGLLPQDGVISIGPDALVVHEIAVKHSRKFKADTGLVHSAEHIKTKAEKEIKKTIKKVQATAKKASKMIKSKGKAIKKPKKKE